MNKEKELSQTACKLLGMTSMLKVYCDNIDESLLESSNLKDFGNILYSTSNELFDLFDNS